MTDPTAALAEALHSVGIVCPVGGHDEPWDIHFGQAAAILAALHEADWSLVPTGLWEQAREKAADVDGEIDRLRDEIGRLRLGYFTPDEITTLRQEGYERRADLARHRKIEEAARAVMNAWNDCWIGCAEMVPMMDALRAALEETMPLTEPIPTYTVAASVSDKCGHLHIGGDHDRPSVEGEAELTRHRKIEEAARDVRTILDKHILRLAAYGYPGSSHTATFAREAIAIIDDALRVALEAER